MRLTAAVVLLTSALLLSACSTHEPEFVRYAPPRPNSAEAVRATTDQLITLPAKRLTSSSPDRLAALTRAAAIQFHSTGGPGMRALTRRYADTLLQGRVSDEGLHGFYSGTRTKEISASTTLRAGIALVAAHRVTRDRRYASAVRAVAATAARPAFGLVRFKGGYAMRTRQRPRRLSVALTALATEFFFTASQLGGPTLRPLVVGGLQTVTRNQAAVGRWYAFVGDRAPMTLEQWGSTLQSLATLPHRAAQGIMGAGIPAIAEAASTHLRKPRGGALPEGEAKGLAHALQALAASPQPASDRVWKETANRVLSAAARPPVAAELALAFAIWQRTHAGT